MSELIPFEEPAHVTSFHTPGLTDPPSASKQAKMGHCESTGRLTDTLAIPTDICTARRGSSAEDLLGSSKADRMEELIEGKEEDGGHLSSSDSATLDGVIELLMMAGRDLAEAVMLVVPEAMQKGDPKWKRDFNRFNSCLMEPWDGPALIAFTDGIQLGAQLDRNGLRPGRFVVSKDGRVILASEVGVVDIAPSMILQKGRLTPGKMLLIDFRLGRVVSDDEIKQKHANKYPYGEWLSKYSLQLDDFTLVMTGRAGIIN